MAPISAAARMMRQYSPHPSPWNLTGISESQGNLGISPMAPISAAARMMRQYSRHPSLGNLTGISESQGNLGISPMAPISAAARMMRQYSPPCTLAPWRAAALASAASCLEEGDLRGVKFFHLVGQILGGLAKYWA